MYLSRVAYFILFLGCFAAGPAYCQEAVVSPGQKLHNAIYFSQPAPRIVTADVVRMSAPLSKAESDDEAGVPDSLVADEDLVIDESVRVIVHAELIKINDTCPVSSNEAEIMEASEDAANNRAAIVSKTPSSVISSGHATTKPGSTNKPGRPAGGNADRLIKKYAAMIQMEPDDIENYPLYRFINDWYGVKYKYGGSDNSGIDCSAFSQKLYGQIYSVSILRTARQQHKNCEVIKDEDDASEGDLVFFRIHHIRVSHVGVYLANGYFVHASRSKGVTISSLNDKYWRRRYAGCGKIQKEDRQATESDFVP